MQETQPIQDTPAQTAVADAKILFANLEFEYLIELQAELNKHIEARRVQAQKDAAEQIRKIAEAAGLSVEDILALGERKSVKPAKILATPKYANPANREETWSGRGRKPKWVSDYLDSGKPIEDLSL